jgi:hypothetical protein
MAVFIETDLATASSNFNSRLRSLKLIRHAYEPSTPLFPLELSNSGNWEHSTNKPHSPPSPISLAKSSQSKLNLLSDLSSAHLLTYRLRIDRDKWRSIAQDQDKQLLSADHKVKEQTQAIPVLNMGNTALRTKHYGYDLASTKPLRDGVIKHDPLADRLADALRTVTRLRRSDRAKGKVLQRNLRLKATLQRYTSEATSLPDDNKEAALQEALAVAKERVEELEGAGEALLEALGAQIDDAGIERGGSEAELIEAELFLRGVVEDEMAKEQKEHWQDLLEE